MIKVQFDTRELKKLERFAKKPQAQMPSFRLYPLIALNQ
jgi:hypothetical protein